MSATKIEWAEHSWNPVVGCSIVSPGCTNCYAMRQAARLHDHPGSHYEGTTRRVNGNAVWTGKVGFASEATLLAPLKRKKPTTWFVNSMGDLFHEDVPDEWIDRIFGVMALAPQHRFQVLTKRAKRMREWVKDRSTRNSHQIPVAMVNVLADSDIPRLHVPVTAQNQNGSLPFKNVWLGISAEDQANWDERKMDLAHTPAAIRFASFEPLLGPIEQPDIGEFIDWAIVGGESGKGARPMHPDWVRSIKNQCASAGIPFFFKQWGALAECERRVGRYAVADKDTTVVFPDGNSRRYRPGGWEPRDQYDRTALMERVGKKAAGRLLDGELYDGMPT